MSTALTGPAANLGLNMKAGVELAFAEANSRGGVEGAKLRLIALDDGYEPTRTAPNMRELIDQHNVLGVIGNVGTPTAVVAAPIAIEKKTLFFGAYTGAEGLRKSPPDRYVINFRASYAEETGAMVDALVENAGVELEEIAFFTQRDAYGDTGYAGGVEAMRRHGLRDESLITHGRYKRNTEDVETAVAEILMAPTPVRAVIMVGAYKPCAKFIELSREVGVEAIFLNVSFVGAAPLRQALGESGDGVIVTQCVPHYKSNLPIVDEYRRSLQQSDSVEEPSFGSLEGYIAARVLLRALETLDGRFDREAVVDALEDLGQFDMGLGEPLGLSRDEHQASHSVWTTVIRPGGIEVMEWKDLHAEVLVP